ncbi:hypothetical protein GVAV_002814 [Gurleya vavrai]
MIFTYILFDMCLKVYTSQKVASKKTINNLPGFLDTFTNKSHFRILLKDGIVENQNVNKGLTNTNHEKFAGKHYSCDETTDNDFNCKQDQKISSPSSIDGKVITKKQRKKLTKRSASLYQNKRIGQNCIFDEKYLLELQCYMKKINEDTNYPIKNDDNFKIKTIYIDEKINLISENLHLDQNKRKLDVEHITTKKIRSNDHEVTNDQTNNYDCNNQRLDNLNCDKYLYQNNSVNFCFNEINFLKNTNTKIIEIYKKEVFDYLIGIKISLYNQKFNYRQKNRKGINGQVKDIKNEKVKSKIRKISVIDQVVIPDIGSANESDVVNFNNESTIKQNESNYQKKIGLKKNTIDNSENKINLDLEKELNVTNEYEILYYYFNSISKRILNSINTSKLKSKINFCVFLETKIKYFENKEIIKNIDIETNSILSKKYFAMQLFKLADGLSNITTEKFDKATIEFGVNYFLDLLKGNLSDFTRYFPEFIFFNKFLTHQKSFVLDFKINLLQFLYFTYIIKKITTNNFLVIKIRKKNKIIKNSKKNKTIANSENKKEFTHFNIIRLELRKILTILLQPFLNPINYNLFLKFHKYETFKVILQIRRYNRYSDDSIKNSMSVYPTFLIKFMFFFVTKIEENNFTTNYHLKFLERIGLITYHDDSNLSFNKIFENGRLNKIDYVNYNIKQRWFFYYLITMIIIINDLFKKLENVFQLPQEKIKLWNLKNSRHFESGEFAKLLTNDEKFFNSNDLKFEYVNEKLNEIYEDGTKILFDCFQINYYE